MDVAALLVKREGGTKVTERAVGSLLVIPVLPEPEYHAKNCDERQKATEAELSGTERSFPAPTPKVTRSWRGFTNDQAVGLL